MQAQVTCRFVSTHGASRLHTEDPYHALHQPWCPATYKNKIAWFSDRCPSLKYARSARSSAAAAALPSLPPSGPLVDVVYVLTATRCDESRDVGRPTWNRLARCAVRCVSLCRWAGSMGREDWSVWPAGAAAAGPLPPSLLPPSEGMLSAIVGAGGRMAGDGSERMDRAR